ncbi:MAG TPA: acetylornithine/succinylornithine family transaminase [Calditrichaeota bacterium]|nr:acetylornithine/succinylornithine family transaminase [Calditrichota bacterium]
MDILKVEKDYFLNVFTRFPIDVEKGRGVYLYDKNGTCYLDFLAGIAVNALGYNHPDILKAIKKQMERFLHLSNYFITDIQVELAGKLLAITPFDKLFFSNSGTEAIEGLLKIVKKWGHLQGKKQIIAFEGSFHGRTTGALSLTMQEKYKKNFLPLLPDISMVPFNDVEAFNQAISDDTAAVIYEGITGEGGVRPVSDFMLDAFRKGRDKYGFLLIADEIQTGVGRTGYFYYFEKEELVPDAIASAKGLGGGLPLGAFMVTEKLAEVLSKGEHGTTYGGNPLACATGLAAVKVISDRLFLDHVQRVGSYFKSNLYELAVEFDDVITDVRGEGLMLGVEVIDDKHAREILQLAIENGLIFNIAGGKTLRFIPPLIVEEAHIDEALEKLRLSFKQLYH